MLTTRTGSPARTSRSAERALTILLVLAEARQPMSFADLQRSLGWPKGSLHALLKTLESQRFVLLDVDKGKYTVGIAAFEVGAAYPAPTDLSDTPQRRYWRNWSEPSTKHATWRCSPGRPPRPPAHEEFVRPALPLIHRIVDHLDETVRPAVEMARQTLRDECRLPSASDSLISRVAERIHSLQWHIGFTIRSPPRWGDIKESDPRTS